MRQEDPDSEATDAFARKRVKWVPPPPIRTDCGGQPPYYISTNTTRLQRRDRPRGEPRTPIHHRNPCNDKSYRKTSSVDNDASAARDCTNPAACDRRTRETTGLADRSRRTDVSLSRAADLVLGTSRVRDPSWPRR